MKNKSYLNVCIIGLILGAIENLDVFVLKSFYTVEEQYMNSIFPFNIFLEYKQYFVSFKVMLVSLVFICFVSNIMNTRQIPYVLLRVKRKYSWEFKLTQKLIQYALSFYFGFTVAVLLMSIYSCGKVLNIYTLQVWFFSWVALTYLGIILGCIANLFACFVKTQIAVILTYILFSVVAYMTMQNSDLFLNSKLLLYLNPITAVSLAEEHSVADVLVIVLVMYIICFICRSLLAYGYVRWGKCVRSED